MVNLLKIQKKNSWFSKMDKKKVNIDGIGLVTFCTSSRLKKVSIKLKPLDGIIVSIPKWVSYKTAHEIVLSKKDWILKSKEKVKIIENNYTVFDENSKLKILNILISLKIFSGKKIISKQLLDEIVVYCPENEDLKSENMQQKVRLYIEKILRQQAKLILPKKVDFFANKFGLKYSKLFFKSAKTRWGSCSSLNNINLNIHLMRLPEHLIDYVIIHELAHILEKNHGKNFWHLIENFTNGKGKLYDKELKKYSPKIF